MMGPEAMGVANANLHWSDDKVCRNFLCGTCPHTLFTNTVRLSPLQWNATLLTYFAPLTIYPYVTFGSTLSNTHVRTHLPTAIENGPRRLPQVAHGAFED
jgi:hypothetical protein